MSTVDERNEEKLNSLDLELKKVLIVVMKKTIVAIIETHRTPQKQLRYFCDSRINNEFWKTDKDGYNKKSKHNYYPSLAFDVVPFPTYYKSIAEFEKLNKIIVEVAKKLDVNLRWGGRLENHLDYAHYEKI